MEIWYTPLFAHVVHVASYVYTCWFYWLLALVCYVCVVRCLVLFCVLFLVCSCYVASLRLRSSVFSVCACCLCHCRCGVDLNHVFQQSRVILLCISLPESDDTLPNGILVDTIDGGKISVMSVNK